HLDWSYEDECYRIQSQVPGRARPSPQPPRIRRHHEARTDRRAAHPGWRPRRQALDADAGPRCAVDRRSVRAGRRREGRRGVEMTGPSPLLDTHAWIWWVQGDARLGRQTLEALD